MFTLKVTYRDQTRKLTFPNANTFPSYDEICTQLIRVFSISGNFYLSKLLFSTDATRNGRILISKEVRTPQDYDRVIRIFNGKTWPNSLLRCTVHDVVATPLNGHCKSSSKSFPTVSGSESGHSRVSNSYALRLQSHYRHEIPDAMNVDEPEHNFSTQIEDQFSAQQSRPLPQPPIHRHDSCCSASQGTTEMRQILNQFQAVITRTMSELSNSGGAQHDGASDFMKVMGGAPPPSLCSVCTRNFDDSQDDRPHWYSCANCHIVICGTCHKEENPGFCLSTMGLHDLQPVEMSGRRTDMPIPHLPAPWVPRSSSDYIRSDDESKVPAAGDSNVPPVIHRGVICDSCNVVIKGVRHKCLDCANYDLCTHCLNSGVAGKHNPFHEFFDITEPGRVIPHRLFSRNDERGTTRDHARRAPTEPPAQAVPASVIHPATCNLCDSRIIGDRYKCSTCPDFDTCSACFSITAEQHPRHAFIRIKKPEDFLRIKNISRPMHYAVCNACSETIYGMRYKCMHPDCPDYDLCGNCEALPIHVHPAFHPMLKMKTPETVIPTVYRVGQRVLIPQPSEAADRPVVGLETTPELLPEDSVNRPETSQVSTPRAREEILPPKPEMMAQTGWASIPTFFDTNNTFDHIPRWEAATSTSDDVHGSRATLRNPFADIVVPESPSTPMVRLPSFSQQEQEDQVKNESRENITQVEEPVISLPSVPNHTPNPWPTTNAEEREELLQRIAVFSSSLTAARELNTSSVAPVTVSLPPPTILRSVDPLLISNEEQLEKNIAMLVDPADQTHAAIAPSESKDDSNEHPSVGFSDFNMSHLLQGIEERIASLKDDATDKPASVASDISISGEPLLNDTRLAFDIRTLSDLVDDLPNLIPKLKSSTLAAQPLGAAFVEDVTVPDGQIFPPGAEFMKCWKLLNDSGRAWPETTELVFVAGESLSAAPVVEIGSVASGAEIHVWTGELKAPEAPGRYVGYWRLRADGELFGNSLWIEINVAESDAHHSSDESMAASAVIMPNMTSPQTRHHVPSTTVQSISTRTSTSSEDNLSDAGSDISLISLPSSPSDDEDEMLWRDSRSQATVDRATASSNVNSRPFVDSRTSAASSAIDYVLLYDDSSSDE